MVYRDNLNRKPSLVKLLPCKLRFSEVVKGIAVAVVAIKERNSTRVKLRNKSFLQAQQCDVASIFDELLRYFESNPRCLTVTTNQEGALGLNTKNLTGVVCRECIFVFFGQFHYSVTGTHAINWLVRSNITSQLCQLPKTLAAPEHGLFCSLRVYPDDQGVW